MKLKATIQSLDEVDEGLRGLYTQSGDAYVLDIDDSDYKKKLTEFRDNNLELVRRLEAGQASAEDVKKLQDQLAQFEGIDPETAREAMKQAQLMADKKLMEAGKIDELVDQRTERMRSDYEGQIDALKKDRDGFSTQVNQYKGRLTEMVIDTGLQSAVGDVGSVRKGAMQDVLSRGRMTWSLDDKGQPVPMGLDGKVMYGKDGNNVLTMHEWAGDLLVDAAYLFEGSSGGGGQGSGPGGGDGSGKIVSRDDQQGMNSNLEAIAAGTVTVE